MRRPSRILGHSGRHRPLALIPAGREHSSRASWDMEENFRPTRLLPQAGLTLACPVARAGGAIASHSCCSHSHPASSVACGPSMNRYSQTQIALEPEGDWTFPTVAAPIAAAADEDDLPIPSDIKTVLVGGPLFFWQLPWSLLCRVRDHLADRGSRSSSASWLQTGNAGTRTVSVCRAGLAAVFLILMLFGTLGGLGAAAIGTCGLAGRRKLPTGIPKLQERLSFLSRPIAAVQKFADQAQGLTQAGEAKPVPVAVQGRGAFRPAA